MTFVTFQVGSIDTIFVQMLNVVLVVVGRILLARYKRRQQRKKS